MNSLKKLLILVLMIFSINSIFAAYPDVEFDGQINGSSFDFKAWSGTTVKVYLNDQPVDTYTIKGDGTSVALTGLIPDVSASTGENIEFIHLVDDYTYDLEFLDSQGDIFWSKEIYTGVAQTQVQQQGQYILRDTNNDETRTLTITDELLEKQVSVPTSLVFDGENTLRFEVEYYSDLETTQTETQEYTFTYEKFENNIDVQVPNNFTKTTAITVNVSVEDDSLPYYYMINQDGNPSSCSFTQNQFFPDGGSTELTINGLYEGENSVRIISTQPDDCTTFTGENRFKVTVDRTPPYLRLYEAFMGLQGDDEGGQIDTSKFDGTAYLNNKDVRLVFDSDASIINYTLNGRGEGPLVDDQVFDQVDWIDSVEIESTGSRLSLEIYPLPEYSTSYVKYSYDGREREEENNNGVISIDLSLDEEDNTIEFKFYEGSGPQVIEQTMQIYDLAYEDKGTIETAEFEEQDELFIIQESLDQGRNVLRLYAYDEAGNLKKKNHIIEFDNSDPEILFDEMKPEGLFKSKQARSPVVPIEGKTNKGDVEITVFSIPDDTTVFTSDGEEVSISCESDDQIILRSLDQLDYNGDDDGPELNLEEQQLTLSVGSLLQSRNKITSNAEGDFEDVYVTLQERNFDRGDYNDAQNDNSEVGNVASDNEICFVMKDKFGNANIDSINVNFDAGNTLWTPGQVTLTPNTVYSSEIEQTGDQRGPSDRVQFSVIATFIYQGDGDVTDVSGLRVNEDSVGQEFRGTLNIQNQDLNYRYVEGSNELLVYFPVQIDPLNIKPLDYPDELELAFAMDLTYDVDDVDVPIDTKNPIYFQTEVNIEKPLDHAKWLSPSTIEDGLEFLNKSIEYTKKAVEWTRMASVAGVVACTGTKLYYQYQIALVKAGGGTESEKEKEINDYKEKIYWVCDRVACSSSPAECQEQENGGNFELGGDSRFDSGELSNQKSATEFISEGENQRTLGRITELDVTKTSCTTSTGEKGVIASFDVETYQEDTSAMNLWKKTEETSQLRVHERCVAAEFEKDENDNVVTDENGNPKVESINLKDYGGACYTEGAPNFDQTRCINKAGWDPKNNVIESAACGCITDTYSHLKNILKVQEGIQKCLQEAKLGMASGSYCERLLSQAVCDVATNLIFSGTIGKVADRAGANGEDPHEQEVGFFTNLARSNTVGNDIIEERYDGTILSQAGMSTEQIVNNVCLAAATGDWSALEESILTSIDENQVEPILGPTFPTSRMMGVNPFTGTLTIQYRFTHAIVSGGQDVRTKVQFICDSSRPGGEYCPPGRHTAEELNGDISTSTLIVREDQSVQDSIVLTDENARFRYNVLQLEHEYEIDNQEQTEEQPERIMHKQNGLLGQCNWNGGTFGSGALQDGYGISCDRLFTDDSLIQQYYLTDNSKLLPDVETGNPVFYPGNPLRLFAQYSISGRDEASSGDPRVYYKITCNDASRTGNTQTTLFDNIKLDHYSQNIYGEKTLTLVDEFPEFAIPKPEGDYITSASSVNIPENARLRVTYLGDSDNSASFSVKNIVLENGDERKSVPTSNLRFPSYNQAKSQFEEEGNFVEKELSLPKGEYSLITLYLNEDTDEDFSLEIIDENGNIQDISFANVHPAKNIEDGTDLENLGTGTCELQTRVLTPQLAQGLTATNFEDFSPANMNLTNVESSKIKEFNFELAPSPDQASFRMDIAKTTDSYCVVDADNREGKLLNETIQIEVPFVTSDDEKYKSRITKENLSVSYSGGRYNLDENFFDISKKVNLDDKQFEISLEHNEGSLLPESFSTDDFNIYISYEDWSKQEHNEEIKLTLTSDCESLYDKTVDAATDAVTGENEQGSEIEQDSQVLE